MSGRCNKTLTLEVTAGLMGVNSLVILTSDADYAVRSNIRALLDDFPQTHILVLECKPRKRPMRLLRNQLRHLRKHGWRWIPEQVGEILSTLGSTRNAPQAYDRPGQEYHWESLRSSARVRCERLPSLNGKQAEKRVRDLQPFLGISLGAPILKPNVFGIPQHGTINLHKGRVPDYRGMPPAFWELYNGESVIGCTVHQVAEGLDTGGVLLTDEIPVSKYSTVRSLRLQLDELGIRMVCEAVRRIAQGTAAPTAQPTTGTTYTRPTLRQEHTLQRLTAKREEDLAGQPRWRRVGKNLVFNSYTHIWRPVTRSLRPPSQPVVVLLYHRVNDDLRDPVTVGIEQFDKQMRSVALNYPTCTIEDLIKRRFPASRRPIVAVTFDDGYLDNYLYAAPILRRHGVPATFFISTGFLGTDKAFPHDLQRLGRRVPAMTWEHARTMLKQGFSFGSHTVSHVNLAAVSDGDALAELTGSRDTIRRELGLESVAFAYPFGKKTDITHNRVDLVRECGFEACCSAYGGVNAPRTLDPFNIRRIGIDFKFTCAAFKARLECWPGA